jgi:hypothetical protein
MAPLLERGTVRERGTEHDDEAVPLPRQELLACVDLLVASMPADDGQRVVAESDGGFGSVRLNGHVVPFYFP